MITIKEAEEILKKEYHIDNFGYLVGELLLPDYFEDKHDVNFDNSLFSSVMMLGESKQCEVTVFEVIINEGCQNRRVGITQKMFRILRGLHINNALVAFVNADKNNYRISLLTSKYEFDGDKIVRVISNPRRYSYSLGFGTKTKTAYKFLIEKGKVSSLDELISRFSVEVVNKQFYTEIATAFTELVGGERNGRKYEKLLGLHSVVDHNKFAEFGVRLIGRIMFCWFLREKRSENGIPLVPDDMLSLDTVTNSNNYYHQVLEPLFFEILNTNQNRRKPEFQTDYYSKVPYLNGGLFSPQTDDHYKYDAVNHCGAYGVVSIPNEWFNRLYAVLNEYNFTVDENTAYDIELSIDPEMLGRIFENLLAEINPETGENAKKSTGSFYTPRDIVDYMVDSSLCEYLKTKTDIAEIKLKALISYSKEDDDLAVFDKAEKKKLIDALYTVTALDPACGSGAFPIGMLQKIVYMLQELDPSADLWFDKATENAPRLLKQEFERKFNSGSLNYIRKLCVIQNSIFGIDIQPIAVEISRLRCFLSLIIEEKVHDDEENRGINPLPNLDFKFIIANSLLKLENDGQLSLFENQEHIDQLKAIREEYFNADSGRRTELKLEFANVQQDMLVNTINNYDKQSSRMYAQLSAWKPFANESTDWFDPEWMFGIKDGFDIVIGNPPYIGEKGHKELFRPIASTEFGKRFYQGKMDYFYFFFHKGLDLLVDNGELAFITTNYYPTATGAKKLRRDFKNRACIRALINFNEVKVFESAAGQHNMITLLSKKNDEHFPCKSLMCKGNDLINSKDLSSILINSSENMILEYVEQSNLYDGDECYIRQEGVNFDNDNNTIGSIINKMMLQETHLGDLADVNQGVLTGCDTVANRNIDKIPKESNKIPNDGIFVFDLCNSRDLVTIASFSVGKKLLRDFYKNSDITRYYCSSKASKKILYYPNELQQTKYPDIYAHLLKFKPLLESRLKTYNEHYHWTAIHRTRDEKIFLGPKIVVPYRSKRNSFAYNNKEWFCRTDSYIITAKNSDVDLFYLLGVLNSKLNFLWLYHRGKRKGEILELFQVPLCEIPIIRIERQDEKRIAELAEKITKEKAINQTANTSNMEEEIDRLLYNAYSLSPEEIALVEESVK